MKATVMLYSMNITKLPIHDNFREGSNPHVSVFSGVRVTRSLVLCVMFCRSLFVPLYFYIWPLSCLFFFDLRIQITSFVFSNCSMKQINVSIQEHVYLLFLFLNRFIFLESFSLVLLFAVSYWPRK